MTSELQQLNKRFDSLEKLLIKHRDMANPTLSDILGKLEKGIESNSDGIKLQTENFEKFIQKVEPIIKWFNEMNIAKKIGKKWGRTLMWILGLIIAIGGAFAVAKGFFIK